METPDLEKRTGSLWKEIALLAGGIFIFGGAICGGSYCLQENRKELKAAYSFCEKMPPDSQVDLFLETASCKKVKEMYEKYQKRK